MRENNLRRWSVAGVAALAIGIGTAGVTGGPDVNERTLAEFGENTPAPISTSSGNLHQVTAQIIDEILPLAGDTFNVSVDPDTYAVTVELVEEVYTGLDSQTAQEIEKRADLGNGVEIQLWKAVAALHALI